MEAACQYLFSKKMRPGARGGETNPHLAQKGKERKKKEELQKVDSWFNNPILGRILAFSGSAQ